MTDTPAAEQRDPFEGTSYRGLQRLDEGGTGEVFAVEHRQLRRKLVAKVLHAELLRYPQVVDRMRLEAQTLGRLNHPNIVSIAGFGTTADGRPFLVMELLRGRTLRVELLERGALPPSEALHCALEVLSGLGAAHALGIVHRDVKPDNLFVVDLPNGGRSLKILDFGIARVLPGAPAAAPKPLQLPTESGVLIGTPRFLSPEGAQGERVDTRADLYGVALVLYATLAGHGPFDHVEGGGKVLHAHANEAPRLLSEIARQPIPKDLDPILSRALAKDPADRYQTAAELAAVLARVAASLPPPSGWLDTAAHVVSSKNPPPPTPVESGVRPAPAPATAPGRPSSATAALVEPAREKTGPWAPSRLALAIAFVVGTAISALAAAALVRALVGAR